VDNNADIKGLIDLDLKELDRFCMSFQQLL